VKSKILASLLLASTVAVSSALGAGTFTVSGKLEGARPVVASGVVFEVVFSVRSGGVSIPAVCRSGGCVSVIGNGGKRVDVTGTLSRDERTGGVLLIAQNVEVIEP
jgi:hypothetical protein